MEEQKDSLRHSRRPLYTKGRSQSSAPGIGTMELKKLTRCNRLSMDKRTVLVTERRKRPSEFVASNLSSLMQLDSIQEVTSKGFKDLFNSSDGESAVCYGSTQVNNNHGKDKIWIENM